MIYKIKKGCHYSGFRVAPFIGSSMEYIVKFDSSCLATNENDHINKLFGFSHLFHHQNSFRFGWVGGEDKIQIFSYCYIDGLRVICPVFTVLAEKENVFKISLENNEVKFFVNNICVDRLMSEIKKAYGYKLFPYFGGVPKAPKDLLIELK